MLITAAPAWMALPIASPEEAHVIPPSVPGATGSGTLSARALGHTPRTPTPFSGAAATAGVAVPCELVTGTRGMVLKFPPAHSGCVASAAASTNAIRGLVGTTAGGMNVRGATFARHAFGGLDC